MPGVIEVIIIMAIYNAIKKRGKKDHDKALVEAAFPTELQAQIGEDYADAVALYAAQSHARALLAAAGAAASGAGKGGGGGRVSAFLSLFGGSKDPKELKDGKDGKDLTANKDETGEADETPPVERPGTPQPTDPVNPVALKDAPDSPTSPMVAAVKEQQIKERPRSILSRLYTASSADIRKDSPPPTPQSTDSQQQQLKVKFDNTKASAEGTASVLLLWAVVDALKKGAKARKILIEQHQSGGQAVMIPTEELDEVPQAVEDSATATAGFGSGPTSVDETIIGKTQREREMQILTPLKTEALLCLLRMIQVMVRLLGNRVGIPFQASSPSPTPAAANLEAQANDTKEDFESEAAASQTGTTTSILIKPVFEHDKSKYNTVLLNKLKLGWGPVGMILECATKDEAVKIFETTRGVEDEDDASGGEEEGADTSELYLVDCIVEILRSRDGVSKVDVDWV